MISLNPVRFCISQYINKKKCYKCYRIIIYSFYSYKWFAGTQRYNDCAFFLVSMRDVSYALRELKLCRKFFMKMDSVLVNSDETLTVNFSLRYWILMKYIKDM